MFDEKSYWEHDSRSRVEEVCEEHLIHLKRLQDREFMQNLIDQHGRARADRMYARNLRQVLHAIAFDAWLDCADLEGIRKARREVVLTGKYRSDMADRAFRAVMGNYLRTVQLAGGSDPSAQVLQHMYAGPFVFASTFLVASQRNCKRREMSGCITNCITWALKPLSDGDGYEYAMEVADLALQKLLERHKKDMDWPKSTKGLIKPGVFAACGERLGRKFRRDPEPNRK